MTQSKTGGPLKGIFDPAKKAAAAAVMDPPAASPAAPIPVASAAPPDAPRPAIAAPAGARNRKAGGRNVRISGYIPPELDAALRDEVIRRTAAERRPVSVNDVLCDALRAWAEGQAKP